MRYEAVCEYFGFEVKFDVSSFLPKPTVPKLEVKTRSVNEQEALRIAVKKIYDINKDDAMLRRVLNQPTGKKCALFDRLRKEYPIRREFWNTQITADSREITTKLSGIG